MSIIRGNKEEYWITHRKNACEIWKDGKTTTGILKYVYDQLNDDDIDMFEAMPIEMTLKYDGLPRFTICHGSPFKVNQSMRPDYEYIDNLLENMPSNLIICGHSHIQTDYVRNDVRVINPGAVGVALHSNSLAQFMTLTGKDGHWEPQFFSVGYDVDKVIDEMEKERLDFKAPGWFRMTKNLLTTGEKLHLMHHLHKQVSLSPDVSLVFLLCFSQADSPIQNSCQSTQDHGKFGTRE